MRLLAISPHFRPALCLLQRAPAAKKIPSATLRTHHPLHFRRYCCQPLPPSFDDDMGKEDKSKSFNLKVPKGTRDCKPCDKQPAPVHTCA